MIVFGCWDLKGCFRALKIKMFPNAVMEPLRYDRNKIYKFPEGRVIK